VLQKQAGQILLQELFSMFDTPTKGLPISEYYKKVAHRKENIKILEKGV
jgi:hypothetical protein